MPFRFAAELQVTLGLRFYLFHCIINRKRTGRPADQATTHGYRKMNYIGK